MRPIDRSVDLADYLNGPYLEDELPLDPWREPYKYEHPAETLQGFALYIPWARIPRTAARTSTRTSATCRNKALARCSATRGGNPTFQRRGREAACHCNKALAHLGKTVLMVLQPNVQPVFHPLDLAAELGIHPLDLAGELGVHPLDFAGELGVHPTDLAGELGVYPPDLAGELGIEAFDLPVQSGGLTERSQQHR